METNSTNDRLQLRLQQLLSRQSQSLSNHSQSPISEESFYSTKILDGVVEFFSTDDMCIVCFEFSGIEFNFDGFCIISEEKLISMLPAEILETLVSSVENTYHECLEKYTKETPRVLH